jgi:general secretion pathway protein A
MEQIGGGKMGKVGVNGTGMDPFGVSPDPRFIYFSEKLRRDYEALLPVLRRGHALVVVLGARGIGKTMLLRAIAGELEHQDHCVIYKSCLGSPSLNEIVNIFGVEIDRSQMLAEQKDGDDEAGTDRGDVFQLPETQTTLLLDDADGLTEESLSAVAALPGQTSKTGSTVSVILAGSSKLYSRLEQWSNSLGGQPIDFRVPLTALEPEDVASYIVHRLQIAGFDKTGIFALDAIRRVAYFSEGNPQVINRICRAAKVIAAKKSFAIIPADVVDQVAPGGDANELTKTSDEIFILSKLDIAPLLKHSRGPFSPEPSAKPALRTGMDIGLSDAPSESWHRFHPAVPSGRDMTFEVSRNADDTPAPRFRVASGMSWAAAGVLSAIGATALYFFVSGNAIKNSAPTSVTLSTAAVQQDQNVTEHPGSVASGPSRHWVEPPPNDSWRSPNNLDPAPTAEGVRRNTGPGVGANRLSPETIHATTEASPSTSTVDARDAYDGSGSPPWDTPFEPAPSRSESTVPDSADALRVLDADRLKVRGDGLLSIGDVASARLVYRLAALNGSAVAAIAMGSTYDPTRLSKTANDGGQSNVEEAVRWYKKAIAMGEKSAEIRLLNLTGSPENP